MREGLLLINLGSPDEPDNSSVRRYLREFLMDRHVVDLHWASRALLVHGVIAPLRAPKSARAYRSIWERTGSPLLSNSKLFAESVGRELPDVKVELAMRYGRPSIRSALKRMREAGVESLSVVPLYPQFAKSSSLTAMESVLHELDRAAWKLPVKFLKNFYREPEWIRGLVARVKEANASFQADFLLLSYHGLPERHIRELDRSHSHCLMSTDCCERAKETQPFCYRSQCYETSNALIEEAEWSRDRFSVSFQSRLGRRPWIKPYSDQVIVQLAQAGVRRVLVACPSFVADCLETLEEVAIRMRKDFITAGGEDLKLVPAVNGSKDWVSGFIKMIQKPQLKWLNPDEALSILAK